MSNRSIVAVLGLVAAGLVACGPKGGVPPTAPKVEAEIRLDGPAIAAELKTAMLAAGVVPPGATPSIQFVFDRGARRLEGARVSWEQMGFRVEGSLTAGQVAERIRDSLSARGMLPAEGMQASAHFLPEGALALRYSRFLDISVAGEPAPGR